jgi:predicted RNase H-like HicB family nuclease
MAHGETRLAALESAEQAIEAWVSSALADNQPIPDAARIGVEN